METKPLAMSPEVARQRSWNIIPAFSRDYCSYGYFELEPTDVLINPSVVLRRLHTNYIVPLVCDFCARRRPTKQASARLWCGECPVPESFSFWFN